MTYEQQEIAQRGVHGMVGRYDAAMAPVAEAVARLEAEGWTLPVRNPSNTDTPLYDVVNAAQALVQWWRSGKEIVT